jgi:hypothetical protein
MEKGMLANYLSYAGLGIGFIVFICFEIIPLIKKEKKATLKLSALEKIADWTIAGTAIASIIGALLKTNSIIDFDAFTVVLFVVYALFWISSILGFVAKVIAVKKRQLNNSIYVQAKTFLKFALYVCGAAWAASDLILSFNWIDYITKLIEIKPIQKMPIISIAYIALIYVNCIFSSKVIKRISGK